MEAHFRSANALIAGLGLIGGSVAKALREAGMVRIDALETDGATLAAAQSEGTIRGVFRPDCGRYDIVICALAPREVPALYDRVRGSLKSGGVFAELSGLKTGIMRALAPALADDHELLCLHPMAGSEKSGYAYSDAALFRGAKLILTPTERTGEAAMRWASVLCDALGCGDMPALSAEEHDRIIAQISHLPHIAALAVRNAGWDSEAYAGGSYRSVTRVADINAPLWAGLFTDNAEYLLKSIQSLRASLAALEAAVQARDAAALERLLQNISAREDS